MEKKIAKIGMIAVLTLALILSSLGVFNFGDTLSKEFKVDATNEITAQAAPTPWDGTTKTAFTKGDGSANNPYEISNGAELAYLAQQVNTVNNFSLNKHYKLTADIDLGGKPWTPIGIETEQLRFSGTLEGNTCTISGVSVTSTLNDQGLFGATGNTAVIKNLGVINTNIIITNVGNNPIRTGGIVGWNKGLIINCFHNGNVNGIAEVGGIVGLNEGDIRNCYNHGAVTYFQYKGGGLIGRMFFGTLTNCYSTAVVDATFSISAAGIVGESYDDRIFWSHFLQTETINKGYPHTGNGNCHNCQTFSDTDKGASILGILNQQAAAYNATTPPPAVKAAEWIQVGNDYPSFAWGISIDETKITAPYNGQPQAFVVKPSAGVPSEFTVKYKLNGSLDSTYTTVAPTQNGSYDVNVTRPADPIYIAFDKTITNGLVIEKVKLTVTPGVALTKVYDGNTAYNGEIVYGTNYTLNKVGTEEVFLTLGTKTFNSKDVLTATTVTINYTAVLTGADKDNYTIVAGSFNNTATITAKPLTNIKTEKVYDGNANFSLTLSSANCDGFVANSALTITFTTAKSDKGTYTGVGKITTLTRTGADKDNYSFTEANITAAITNQKLPAITAMNPATYNGGEQTPTVTIPGLTLTNDYTLTWEFKAADKTTFAPITGTPVFKNAGTYRVTATGVVGGNYENSTTDANYEITQKEVVLSWTNPPTGLVYDGSAKIPGVIAGGVVSGETCSVTAGLTSDTMSNITAGQFTFTATALSNPNYKLPIVANCVSGNYTITKATDANIWTKTLTITGITEGGTLNPIAEAKYGKAEYTYYSDSAKANLIAKPTAAGTYFVTAKVVATTSYDGITETDAVQFAITPRQPGGGGGGGGGGGSSGGGGGGSSSKDVFWIVTVNDINNKKDTVIKKQCDFDTMPKKVLEAIQNKDKTLDITMKGENLYITSEKIKGLTFDKAEYTIEEIKAMLADKPVITPTPTEKPTEPTVPEEPANLLWLWILLGIIAVGAVVTIVIVVKKKKKGDEDNNK